MTLLNNTLAVDESDLDLLSPNEQTPKSEPKPEEKARLADQVVTCRFCPEQFTGAWGPAKRGMHERKMHPAEFEAAKALPKPPRPSRAKPPGTPRAKPQPKTEAPPKPQRILSALTEKETPKERRLKAGDEISRWVVRFAKVFEDVDPPVARVLQFEAAAAGEALDELVANTWVDRTVVQRMAKASDKWEKVGSVISLPIMIAMIERFPKLANSLEEELREAVEDVIVAAIPTIKKRQERRNKATQALKDLGELDPDIAASADPIGAIIQKWFLPPQQASADANTE